MLQPNKKSKLSKSAGTFAIIASRYNDKYVGAMLRAAQKELKRAGATVLVVRGAGGL